MSAKWAYKPGSVVNDHSSRRTVTDTLKQPTRIRRGPRHGCLFGLASSGVYRTGLLPDSWCALTAPFHPYHARLYCYKCRSAVYSLLHFPSAHTAQALPGTLPYEARTFLPCMIIRTKVPEISSAATVQPTLRVHSNKLTMDHVNLNTFYLMGLKYNSE